MKPFPKIVFIVVVSCQFLVLGGMIAKQVHLLKTGDVVLLKCQPIDPRSLFSGDYVILSYTISRFSEEEFQQLNRYNEDFEPKDSIYVALQQGKESKFWNAAAISHDRKKFKAEYPVVIKGSIRARWQQYQIRYGVESYFVPQFEGRRIEREISNASVEVAVSNSGESGIKRLFIGEEEVKFY
jgi:uncharacterized membrane-anchored protein